MKSSPRRSQVAVWAGLVLLPFGSTDEHLAKENPWTAFDDNDPPQLVVLRAERVADANCERWLSALESVGKSEGKRLDATNQAWRAVLKEAWEPWKEEEQDDLRDCDELPCDIKLGPAETKLMAAAPKDERPAKYLEVVEARIRNYARTQDRKEYEFPGDPIDPWARFEGKGFRTALSRPADPALYVGQIALAPGKAKNLHQVLDRRFARSSVASVPAAHARKAKTAAVATASPASKAASRMVPVAEASAVPDPAPSAAPAKPIVAEPASAEGVLWVRDAYTDHYFDSWGEWHRVSCHSGSVHLVQALVLELDLLKKNDLLSRIGRGKMKSAVRSQGTDYLQRMADLIRQRAVVAQP